MYAHLYKLNILYITSAAKLVDIIYHSEKLDVLVDFLWGFILPILIRLNWLKKH